MKNRIVYAVLGIVLVSVSSASVWAYTECYFSFSHSTYPCYEKHTRDRLQHGGIQEAVTYVTETVQMKAGFNYAHLLFHIIGEQAYYQTRNIEEAFGYVDPLFSIPNTPHHAFYGLNGFAHGVLVAYLQDNASIPFDQTAITFCTTSPRAVGTLSDEGQCYHGFGHAFMSAGQNKVEDAVANCKQAVGTDMQRFCYAGVFMENTLLVIKEYHPNYPRPDAQNASSKELCAKFDSDAAEVCNSYAGGYVYFSNNSSTRMKDAFAECRSLASGDFCIRRLAGEILMPVSKSKKDAEAVCEENAGIYVMDCLGILNILFANQNDAIKAFSSLEQQKEKK